MPRLRTLIVAALVVLGALFVAACMPAPQPPTEIAWGTSRAGSSGDRALKTLAAMLNRKMPDYRIAVELTPGAIYTVKSFATGGFDGYYGSDVAFYELANDVNRFAGFEAEITRQPVQSFWAYTFDIGLGIHARDRDKFTAWGDLAGQPVFTGPAPFDTRAQLERAFIALGIDHDYREAELHEAHDALDAGHLAAIGVYATAEHTTAPWIAAGTADTDWVPLNPSADEVARLEAAGFEVTRVDPAAFGMAADSVDEVIGVRLHYGFHVGLEVPADDVYRMLTIIEANAAALTAADGAFKQLETDMPGMQRRGVASAVAFVPVHPGLARYMRERAVWDPAWNDRIATAD
ncbi:MAG: TRAP transporter substrate-binding protein [Alphaproteobacteria bacterium]|nr:TRAP transporter substrate-binding protein [Alphaproteobacteria bacterium]